MPGETDLTKLLKSLRPRRHPGQYVFCSLKSTEGIRLEDVLFHFKEAEGTTVVLKKDIADRLQLEYSFIAAWITLTVHSSLEAVGLTAAVATDLAKAGISCNGVSAFFHDHLFVPEKDAEKAMRVLRKLSDF
jgi:hypothetical protein